MYANGHLAVGYFFFAKCLRLNYCHFLSDFQEALLVVGLVSDIKWTNIIYVMALRVPSSSVLFVSIFSSKMFTQKNFMIEASIEEGVDLVFSMGLVVRSLIKQKLVGGRGDSCTVQTDLNLPQIEVTLATHAYNEFRQVTK